MGAIYEGDDSTDSVRIVMSQNSSTTMSPDCTKTALEQFSDDFQHPQGVITLIIAILGITFNILNVIVLTDSKMKSPVNLLLMFLGFAEIGLLLVYIPYVIIFNLMATPGIPQYITTSRDEANYFLFYADASVFLHMSAIWLIITTAFFRFLLVQFPIPAAKWCTYKRAVIAGAVTFIVCLFASMPNIVRNSIVTLEEYPCYQLEPGVKYYGIDAREHFKDEKMEMFNYWLFATIGKFIPSILLMVFTIFLIKVLRDAQTRRKRLHVSTPRNSSVTSVGERRGTAGSVSGRGGGGGGGEFGQTTRMLLAVVVLFFMVEFSHGVLVLWAGLTDNIHIYNHLGEVIDLLTLTAFSVNFILYCTMSRQYRLLFLALITKPFKLKLDYPEIQLKDSSNRRNSCSRLHTENVSFTPSELHPLNCKTHQKTHHSSSGSGSNNTLTVGNGSNNTLTVGNGSVPPAHV